MKKIWILILTLIGVVALIGAVYVFILYNMLYKESPPRPMQIANPASKFCVDNGGTLDIRAADDGSQTGYCIIRGEKCEEWALFRGECSNVHVCTDAEKQAEICTLEYMPVCGSDKKTYGNKCGACAAKVNYWTAGECQFME